MLKKIILIIIMTFTFFITSNVKADVARDGYINNLYYKITNNDKTSMMSIYYHKNLYTNHYIYVFDIKDNHFSNSVVVPYNDFDLTKYNEEDLFKINVVAYLIGRDYNDLYFYAYVQRFIWQLLYPDVIVDIVDNSGKPLNNSEAYESIILSILDEYKFEDIYYIDIDNIEDDVYIKDFESSDNLLSDKLFVMDNKVYLKDYYAVGNEYMINTNTLNNGYIYKFEDYYAVEYLGLPGKRLKYVINSVPVVEEINDIEEEVVDDEPILEEIEDEVEIITDEEEIDEVDDNVEDEDNLEEEVIIDEVIVEEINANNDQEEILVNDEISETTSNIVLEKTNDEVKVDIKPVENLRNNSISIIKTMKSNENTEEENIDDDNIIYEYNNDEKGALVYSEEKKEEANVFNYQSSIFLVLFIILLCFIKKIISFIKSKRDVKLYTKM